MATKTPVHTLGPWRPGNAGSVVSSHCDGLLPSNEEAIEYYNGHVIAETVASCNIPVICAAPDLLEALDGLVGALNDDSLERYNNAMEKATAAIAKANGEKQ